MSRSRPRSCSTRPSGSAAVTRSPEEAQNPRHGYVRLRHHRRRARRRGGGVQGARARRVGRDRRPRVVRRQLPVHRLPAVEGAALRRRQARRQRPAYSVAEGVGASRLHGQPAAGRAEPDDSSHKTALEKAGAVAYRGHGPDRRPRPRRGPPRRRGPRPRGAERRRRRRLRLEGAADCPGSTRSSRGRTARRRSPGAAEEPPRPRRRPDRLRDGPGLRPIRRPDADRPVRRPAHADRPSAQRRGRVGRAARVRRRVRLGVRAVARAAGGRHRRRPRHRPRRRLDGRGPRDPARGRPVVPARRPRARALRHRHERAHGDSRATAGSGSPRGCG